ncbi:hypothetical protein ACJRO7_000048 [Eucalyptus globulus]|uniref:Uncharacterized protein n=1 Tax=Eucalyptus globulus TaxID=34317 RepID=A0ABD3LW47_EUCGL
MSCSECSPNAFALSEIPFVYVQEFLVCSAENSLVFTNLFARVARSSLKLAVQGLADGNGPKLFTAASDELSMAIRGSNRQPRNFDLTASVVELC